MQRVTDRVPSVLEQSPNRPHKRSVVAQNQRVKKTREDQSLNAEDPVIEFFDPSPEEPEAEPPTKIHEVIPEATMVNPRLQRVMPRRPPGALGKRPRRRPRGSKKRVK